MRYTTADSSAPRVSVIVRRRGGVNRLLLTLFSVLRQTYGKLQVISASQGGRIPAELIDALGASGDSRRIVAVSVPADAGLAHITEAALGCADGEYVAYADEGDVFYPGHIERLVRALENHREHHVAYANHYRTYYRRDRNGSATVLSKVLPENPHFDRLWLCRRDYIPLTALLHRRELLDRTGPCNAQIKHLVDWDLTRRMAFYSDFHHVSALSAERCTWLAPDAGITPASRREATERLHDQLLLRTHRPPKPWPNMPDLSIIFLPHVADEQTMQTLRQIWRWTFAPHEVVLPLPPYELSAAQTEMPNLVRVPVPAEHSPAERLDEALRQCEGEYVAVIPAGLDIADGWIETALCALIRRGEHCHEGIVLDRAAPGKWAAVLRKEDLLAARRAHATLSPQVALERAGIPVRRLRPGEIPFQYEAMICQAEQLQRIGHGLRAARVYEQIEQLYPHEESLHFRRASALFVTGRHDTEALDLCRQVNLHQPTVESLMLEARLHRRGRRVQTAVALLEQSRRILESKG